MKYAEIDGERVIVYFCSDCPFEGSTRANDICQHPSRSTMKYIPPYTNRYGDPFPDWSWRHGTDTKTEGFECPLRKVYE